MISTLLPNRLRRTLSFSFAGRSFFLVLLFLRGLTLVANGQSAPANITYNGGLQWVTAYATRNTPLNLVPSAGTGGAATSYSISPALPPGATLDIITGAITGTRSAVTAPSIYRITASNASGSTTFDLAFGVDDVPDFTGLGIGSVAPAAVFSMRKVNTGYNGFAALVRRKSDDSTRHIGFTASGDLDTVALKTFVGTSATDSGFVQVWYNQSGTYGFDSAQLIPFRQPIIVGAGKILRSGSNNRPMLRLDGGRWLTSKASVPINGLSTFSANAVAMVSSTSGIFGRIISVRSSSAGTDEGGIGNGSLLNVHSSNTYLGSIRNGNFTGDGPSTFSLNTPFTAMTMFSPSGTGFTDSIMSNLRPISRVMTISSGGSALGTNMALAIGWSNVSTFPSNNGNPLNGGIAEVLLLPSILPLTASSNPRVALAANQASYYGITVTAPSGISYPAFKYYFGKNIPVYVQPTNGSTGAAVTFSVSPTLPAGLTFNTATGIISGIPTVTSTLTTYTVTASNTAGSTTTSFSMAVNETSDYSAIGLTGVNATAMYSLRKLNASYTGPAIAIQVRAAGSAFTSTVLASGEIGFDGNGTLDTAAMKTLVAARDAYISLWYDQSGKNRTMQAYPGGTNEYPLIMSAGVIKTLRGLPALDFNWSGRTVLYTNELTVDNAASAYANAVLSAEQAGTTATLLGSFSSTGAGNGMLQRTGTNYLASGFLTTGGGSNINGGAFASPGSIPALNTPYIATFKRGATTTSGYELQGGMYIGRQVGGGNPSLNGFLSELLVLPTINTTQQSSMERSQAAYYFGQTITSPATTSVCNGQALSYTATASTAGTFTWSRAAVAGISNAASLNNISGTITETLVNTTAAAIVVPYTITFAGTATGITSTYIINVTVNPAPQMSTGLVTTCSGVAFNFTPTGTVVPAGTTYTWGDPVITVTSGAITGGSAVIVGQLSVNQVLSSSSISNGTATYTITPLAAGCQGNSFTLTVTVQPPVTNNTINNSTPTICSGNSPAAFTAGTPAGGNGSYTYLWESSTDGTSFITATGTSNTATYAPGVLTQDTWYRRTVSSSTCNANISSSFKITVTGTPLVISTQPVAAQTICNNTVTTLTIVGAGASGSYAYQWHSNGSNSNIGGTGLGNGSGAQTATYTVPATATAGDRYYYAVITDASCGTTLISNPSTITTRSVLSVATQPTATQTICNNTGTTLTVAGAGASGSYTYQWFSNNSNSNTGGTSLGSGSGAQTTTYTVPATLTAGDRFYYVVITDATCGVSISSNSSSVTTRSSLSVATQPTATQTICNNTGTTLTVAGAGASGSYTYQWFSNNSNSNTGGASLGSGSGAQTATYTVPATLTAGDRFYYVVITSTTCGVSVSSDPSTITTRSALSVATQPVATQTICNNAGTTLTVAGAGASGFYTYQWFSNISNSNTGGASLGSGSGAQTAAYTVPATLTAGDRFYYVVITDATCGVSISSDPSTITTRSVLSVGTQPVATQTICNNTGTTLTVVGAGASGSYTYQWFSNNSNSNIGGTSLGSGSGAQTTNYAVSATITGGDRFYYVVITDASCGTITSNVATVSTRPELSIGAQPLTQISCNNVTVTISAAGAGGALSYTYQWYSNNINSNSAGTLIPGAVAATYVVPASAVENEQRYFYAVVTDATCTVSAPTQAATITTGAVFAITSQPVSQTICNNSPVAISTVVAGGSLSYTYQWYSNASLSNSGGTPVPGATAAVYTVPGSNIAGDRYFYAVITEASCGQQLVSNPVTLVTRPLLTVGVVPVNQLICNNTSVDVRTQGTGGSGVYTYQWYSNTSLSNTGGTNLGSLQGANTDTYSVPATSLTGDRYFYAEIRDVGCSQIINTSAFSITTSQVLGIQTQPQPQVTCNNSAVTITVVPVGGTGLYTYQWFSNTTNSNTGGTNLGSGSGAQTASYTVPATIVSGDRYYYVVFTDASCGVSIKSSAAKITTGLALSVGTQPLSQTVCNNATVEISAAGAGASLSYTYQWFSNGSNSNSGGTIIPGAIAASYTVPATVTAGNRFYYVLITDASCGLQVTTNAVTVTTRTVLGMDTQPLSQTICNNTTVNLSISAVGGAGNYSYQWYSHLSNSNSGGTHLGSASGASTAIYTVPADAVSGNRYYYAVIRDETCGVTVTTDPATIFTRTALIIVTQPQALQTVINNTSATLSVSGGGASGSYSYQWYVVPTGTNTGGTAITGATGATYTVPATSLSGSRYYYAMVTDIICGNAVASTVAELVTTATLAITAQPLSQTVCNNTATTLSVQVAGGSSVYSYQWYSNTTNTTVGASLISGANTATYTVPATNLINDRYYYVTVTDSSLGNSITSNLTKIITLTGTPVVVSTHPASNTSICTSGSVVLRVVGIGGSSGRFVYQWFSNTTNSNMGGTLIAGATDSIYTRSFATVGSYYYYATVADPTCGGPVPSNVATVLVKNSPAVTVTPVQQSVCNEATALTATALTTGGAGTVGYQWYANTINANTGGISLGTDNGARTLSFTPTSTAVGTQYYYMEASFSGSGCGVARSNTHQVTVRYVAQASDIVISTATTSLCKGLSTSLTAALAPGSIIQDPVFTWYADANFSTEIGSGTAFSTPVLNASTTYYVKVSGSNACENLPGNGQLQTITVTQQAPALVQPANQNYCAGINSAEVIFASSIPGTTYSWSTTGTGIGIPGSGNGNIPSFLTVNNGLSNAVASISVTPYANGCTGVAKSFTITVVPNALVNDTTLVVCSGTPLSYTPTNVPAGKRYSWLLVSVATGISGATDNPVAATAFSQSLTNSSPQPLQAVYAVTPDGCNARTFTVTVKVNPVPQIGNHSLANPICYGAGFSQADFAGVVPTGTLFSWTAPVSNPLGAVTGGNSQSVPQSAVSEKNLYHSRTDMAQALYQVTPYGPAALGGCTGQPFTLTVPVNPKPLLLVTSVGAICNHTTAVYTPSSLTAGVSYTWKRTIQPQISNPAASGVNGFAEALHNTGTAPVLVDYEYTLTVNGCSNTQIVQVQVNPDPVLNSSTRLNVCSGALLNYSPSSLTNGTSFAWSRQIMAGIKNTANSGTSDIFEALVNTTNAPVVVSYRFTLTANGCSRNEDVLVTVNPIPVVAEQVDQAVCNGSPVQVTFSGSSIAGTVYNWTNTNGNIGLSTSGKGNLSFTAVNRISVSQSGYISVEPVANGCSGNPRGFYVMVNPTPGLSSSLTPQPVCSNSVFTYLPESATESSSYGWSRGTVTGISNAPASGSGSIRETLISTSSTAVQVPYEVQISANGCSAKKQVIVTVNPTPAVTAQSNKVFCNNSIAVVNFFGSPVYNTTYNWTNDNSDIGILSEGLNDLFFVASNKTSSSLLSHLTVTPEAGGCKGAPMTFSVTISPSLKLKSATTLAAQCSNSLLTYEPLVEGDASATVSWTRPSIYGISNRPASGTGTISEKLVNTTTLPISVTYALTIANKNCSNTENVTVVINPAVNITNAGIGFSVCSNDVFLFSPSSTVSGAQLQWTRDAITGISNAAGSGAGDITEVLVNTTTSPVEVLYKYSIVQGSACSNDQYVKVTVKPLPQLTSDRSVIRCSNESISYTPVSDISGTSFSWSRPIVSGITNNSANGIGGISESLVNKSSQPVEVAYRLSLTNSNSCTNADTLRITIKPNPTVKALTDQAVCKDERTKAVQLVGDLVGTVFHWTNSEPGIGLANSGTGDIGAFIAKNAGLYTLAGVIDVVPELNGCYGTSTTVLRYQVNPGINSQFIETSPVAACPGQLVGPLVASYPNGGDGINYSFQWMTSADGLNFTALTASGSGNRRFYAPVQTRDAWYKMRVSSGGCTAFTDSVKVKMGVMPVVTVSNRENYTISIGNSTQLIASGASLYEWTPRSYVSDPFIANPFVSPVTDNFKYVVKGTNEDGCSDTASVIIHVVQGYSILPQNILTPNGDGYNDSWEIKNIGHYSNNSVIIYNRNGVRVFSQDNYTGGWKGTSDAGAKLPTEVYYYVIKMKTTTGEVVVKGYLNIFN